MKHKFPYCPNCKSENNAFINNHTYKCEDCSYSFFKNVAASVAVVIQKGNEILFTVRNREPKKGFLDLPGGFVDPKETAEETCLRELYEELGTTFRAQDFQYLGSQPNNYWYKNVLYHTCDLFYKTNFPETQEFILEKEEIADIKWVTLKELNLDELGFDSMKEFFRKWKSV